MMHKLDAIGDRDLRETLLFARAQRRPVTADDVATAHEVHRNVARARLERLLDAGLVISSFERRTGRTGPGSGRPAKTYRVAPELAAIEFPERHYERLIALVADALPERARRDRLHEIGAAFGRQLARQARLRPATALRPALERLCSALGRLGYQATLAEVNDDGAVVTTPTCPLRPLVRAQPQLAELDRGMWAGLLAAAFEQTEPATIVCDTTDLCHREREDCRIRLLLASPARRPRLK
jgi:predicted ArsR family transcriptional regulator